MDRQTSRHGTVILLLLCFGTFWPAEEAKAQTGTIQGIVVNSFDNRPYPNAQILIRGLGIGILTNDLGRYLITNVPMGSWLMQVSFVGYGTLSRTVTVTSGATTVADFDFREPWADAIPPVQSGTRLDSLRLVYQDSLGLLPLRDLEDRSRFPGWFRAFLRHSLPNLPTQGPLQYPLAATELFEWMLIHQDLGVGSSGGRIIPASVIPLWRRPTPADATPIPAPEPGRSTPIGGTNINLSNMELAQRETSVAIRPGQEQTIIAASNNLHDEPSSLRVFRSSDHGCSWLSGRLPLVEGETSQIDPSVAWGPDGRGWVAATVKDWDGSQRLLRIRLFCTDDEGASFDFRSTVSEGGGNDKEMLAVAPPGDPHEGRIYMAWSQLDGSGLRFRWSDDGGHTWSPIGTLSNRPGIGAHIAIGPDGEVYVAWLTMGLSPTAGPSIVVRTSHNGGLNFGSPVEVAPIRADGYRISIPATCNQMALIYPTLAVDRTSGPARGTLYVTWTDLNRDNEPDPGCEGYSNPVKANVYLSSSSDQGQSWHAPFPLPPDRPMVDQFNPWMDVDQDTGEAHVIYYSTFLDGSRTRTRLLHVRSQDAFNTLTTGSPVSNAWTDDTDVFGISQYGDYNGLAAFKGVAIPTWTDHRSGLPGDKHQIFSAFVEGDLTKTRTCPSATLTLTPHDLSSLESLETREITVHLTRSGTGLADEWISLESNSGEVALVEERSVKTDSSGDAFFTVMGIGPGSTEIVASGAGTIAYLTVQVSAGGWSWPFFFGGMFIFALLLLLWLWKRRHSDGNGGPPSDEDRS